MESVSVRVLMFVLLDGSRPAGQQFVEELVDAGAVTSAPGRCLETQANSVDSARLSGADPGWRVPSWGRVGSSTGC